jgi:U3 small nucleolar RNA-associated protein 20
VAVAKTIRKLPIPIFKIHLNKLINLIVTQGLRSRDITSREKARKALVKVIEEVSPRFLTLIFQEMQDLLTRGYQLHVHLFTVHYILQALNVQK